MEARILICSISSVTCCGRVGSNPRLITSSTSAVQEKKSDKSSQSQALRDLSRCADKSQISYPSPSKRNEHLLTKKSKVMLVSLLLNKKHYSKKPKQPLTSPQQPPSKVLAITHHTLATTQKYKRAHLGKLQKLPTIANPQQSPTSPQQPVRTHL